MPSMARTRVTSLSASPPRCARRPAPSVIISGRFSVAWWPRHPRCPRRDAGRRRAPALTAPRSARGACRLHVPARGGGLPRGHAPCWRRASTRAAPCRPRRRRTHERDDTRRCVLAGSRALTMRGSRLVVCGIVGGMPVAGVTWQIAHYLEGFRRLGCDVCYVEDTGTWPYDLERNAVTDDCSYAVSYLAEVMKRYASVIGGPIGRQHRAAGPLACPS